MLELNENLLNSMPNSWIKQAYVQGFDSESITFKNDVDMFECMEIAEPIYEVIVGTSYKKLLDKIPTVLVTEG